MLPEKFIQRIKSHHPDADEFLQAIQWTPATSVRFHPLKKRATDLQLGTAIKWCPDAYFLNERPVFTLDPLFHAGTYYVQESSSMFLWEILNQIFTNKKIRILDACAAPGGKSTLIASWLNGEGILVSNEVIKSRVDVLLENIIKWGYSNAWVTSSDTYLLGGLTEYFDCIVVDAPCSGEGLFRRDAAAISEWSDSNCEICVGRQQKIVSEILPALETGGYLIYSTCTFNPAENDDNVSWMLSRFPLEVVDIDISAFPEITKTGNGGMAFYPHRVKGEGFYCCVLRKTGEVDSPSAIRKHKFKFEQSKLPALIEELVKNPEQFYFFNRNGSLEAIPNTAMNDFETISEVTKIVGGPLTLGMIKGKDFIPHHSLAMSIHQQAYFPNIELNKHDSLHFLARLPFELSGNPGWNLIEYQNAPLGFVKLVQGRFNNYYPTNWRIRMDINRGY